VGDMQVMLDECITRKCSHAVIEYLRLIRPPVKAHFLIDFMGAQGALDWDWSRKLVPRGDWIVISSDSGKSGPRVHAKGPPLHLILPQLGITSFFLGGKSIVNEKGAERARIIITKIPEVLSIASQATPGDRFKISKQGGGFTVAKWNLNPRDYR
jgi:hypothetical protein